MTSTPNLVPYALNRDQVKSFLGITDATYDAAIELYLPIVSDDLFRVNGVLNQDFLETRVGTVSDTSDEITDIHVTGLAVGNVVEAPGFSSGVEAPTIIEVDFEAGSIKLSASATASEVGAAIVIRTLPVGAAATVAKMVFFKIEAGDASSALPTGAIKSKSIGPLSISYETGPSDKSSAVGIFGYPAPLIAALSTVKRPRFF